MHCRDVDPFHGRREVDRHAHIAVARLADAAKRVGDRSVALHATESDVGVQELVPVPELGIDSYMLVLIGLNNVVKGKTNPYENGGRYFLLTKNGHTASVERYQDATVAKRSAGMMICGSVMPRRSRGTA